MNKNACTLHSSLQRGILLWLSLFDELSAVWLYIYMILFFCSTPAMLFGDVMIYIYDDSTALDYFSAVLLPCCSVM